jgi:hypothetical protein
MLYIETTANSVVAVTTMPMVATVAEFEIRMLGPCQSIKGWERIQVSERLTECCEQL